jgi:hypothetical protein
MGHVNTQMLFSVDAKRIDGADRSRERDKLSASLGRNPATNFGELVEKEEESGSYVAETQGAKSRGGSAEASVDTPWATPALAVCFAASCGRSAEASQLVLLILPTNGGHLTWRIGADISRARPLDSPAGTLQYPTCGSPH